MKKFLMLAACLFASAVVAEEIGDVEFNLPRSQEWKVANELEGKTGETKSKSLVYIPKDATIETTKESFGAVEVDLPSGQVDQESIENMYKLQFPSLKVSVKILDKAPDSVLYEWSLNDEKAEGIHGWTRLFTGDKQTVLLTYQTEDINKVKDKESVWTKVLKDAKIKAKGEVKS